MATNHVTHLALDSETPPVLACETRMPGAVYSIFPEHVTCPDCKASEHYPRSQAIQPEAPATIRAYDVLTTAAMLLTDGGYNAEYDRALVELTSTLIGATSDDFDLMTRILRALKEGA